MTKLTPAFQAAVAFILMKEGSQYPSGRKDGGGRWYPETQYDCCKSIRSPSRAFPYSMWTHCKSAVHVANEYGISVEELKECLKKKNLPLLLGINPTVDTYVANKLKGKERKVITPEPGVIYSTSESYSA